LRIHHVAVFVTDTERSLQLYRNLLGFRVLIDMEIPDGEMFTQATLDDIFKVQGGRSRMVMLQSSDGTVLELQEPSTSAIERTPDEHLRYGATGISELAFAVDDINGRSSASERPATRHRPITSGTTASDGCSCSMTPTAPCCSSTKEKPGRA